MSAPSVSHLERWSFYADMNSDGAVTVSDVWLWVKWVFFAPGDYVVSVMLVYLRGLSTFFEMSQDSFGNVFSFFISLAVWWAVLAFINGPLKDMQKRERGDKQ